MKTNKLLSVALALVMVLSLSVPAFASNTTSFTYTGKGNEAYTVTVPSSLAPGGSGTVKLEGTWQSNRVVTVGADKKVILTNDISGGDAKELAITFEGIELAGDNTKALTTSKTISVASISNALFGTWSGTFNYTVGIDDVPTFTLKNGGNGGSLGICYMGTSLYFKFNESPTNANDYDANLYCDSFSFGTPQQSIFGGTPQGTVTINSETTKIYVWAKYPTSPDWEGGEISVDGNTYVTIPHDTTFDSAIEIPLTQDSLLYWKNYNYDA